MRAAELIDAVKLYDKNADEDALNRAYLFAQKMHYDQHRESGEKYIIHPVAVAKILLEYKLDSNAIIAALLHDTVEDTVASYDSIKALFGKDVAELVQGLTKLEKFQLVSEDSSTAENFQKLILASSKDVRILLIKLADRLHNMRTLKYSKPDKQMRIAKETMEIYVPLAERIGMHLIKNELEDLAFHYMNPRAYTNIVAQLEHLNKKHKLSVNSTIKKIERMLRAAHIKGVVTGRQKTPYSLWKKLQQHNGSLDHIFDIIGFRVIVNTIPQCYQVLGVLHQHFRMIPGRFKDYISTPKDNGYRSLQTSVLCPNQRAIEIQIRTAEMAYESDFGVAAHWQYKQGVHYAGKQYKWMQELLNLIQKSKTPADFLNHTKIHLYQDKLFCFSKDGRLFSMQKGSTALDFAYMINDRMASATVGVFVNGVSQPLNTVLKDGDQVEVMTSEQAEPSKEWLKLVTTPYAKSCIEIWFKDRQIAQTEKEGLALIQKYAAKLHLHFDEQLLSEHLNAFSFTSTRAIYLAVANKKISPREILNVLYPQMHASIFQRTLSLFQDKAKKMVPILGLAPNESFVLANCCHPSVGDAIVGIREHRRVVIHRRECVSLQRYTKKPDLWVGVEWNITKSGNNALPVRLRLIWKTGPSTMTEIVGLLAKNKVQLHHLNTVDQSGKKTEIIADINVEDNDHLLDVLDHLRHHPKIISVFEIKGGK